MAKPSDIKKIELADLQVDKSNAEKAYNKVYSEMDAKIEVIREEYKLELEEKNNLKNSISKDISDMSKEIKNMEIQENWDEATQRGEINEFFLISLFKRCGLDTFWILSQDSGEITAKKTMKNGITVWMVKADGVNPYKVYFAFHGSNLLGVSFRETAKHAGDFTEPFSFIGQLDKFYTVEYTNKITKKVTNEKATFTQWNKKLKEFKSASDIDVIPFSQEIIEEIKLGIEEYWNHYGWGRKIKKMKEVENENV